MLLSLMVAYRLVGVSSPPKYIGQESLAPTLYLIYSPNLK